MSVNDEEIPTYAKFVADLHRQLWDAACRAAPPTAPSFSREHAIMAEAIEQVISVAYCCDVNLFFGDKDDPDAKAHKKMMEQIKIDGEKAAQSIYNFHAEERHRRAGSSGFKELYDVDVKPMLDLSVQNEDRKLYDARDGADTDAKKNH